MPNNMKEQSTVNRMARGLISVLAAAAVVLAPTAAGASDQNIVIASNQTDGAAVVNAGVQYRVAPNGVVDEENGAYAGASCSDCQTFAAAFQLVLVTREYRTFVPQNEAFAANVVCESCLTWAAAKQVIVVTDGPAALTGNGHLRLQAIEDQLHALQASLPAMTLADLAGEVDAAFAELLDVARTEIMDLGGQPVAGEVAAFSS
jgi:putative peptide zinc metalloprotease protein